MLVIGTQGQLARSLLEVGGWLGFEVVALGRPSCDLVDSFSVDHSISSLQPSLVVNAAAYTAVDRAETEADCAQAVNAQGAHHVAAVCEKLGVPLVHVSTDYVFDGSKGAPYDEADMPCPTSAYGRTKLAGEERVMAACERHIIVRTAWVYSPFGHNFLKTMLKLADAKSEIAVVDDQVGNPTYAPHLAVVVLGIAQRVISGAGTARWGIYHAAGFGAVTWRGFAEEIFRRSRPIGGPAADVLPIPGAEYPTLAKRPVDSRLDCRRLESVFGIALPPWQVGVEECVTRLVIGRQKAGLLGTES